MSVEQIKAKLLGTSLCGIGRKSRQIFVFPRHLPNRHKSSNHNAIGGINGMHCLMADEAPGRGAKL